MQTEMKSLLLLVILTVHAQSAMAAEPVYWNRDGSAAYPDAEVLHDFDGASGKGILWKAPLPNWSNGGPIVDAGKVFVTAEPVAGYAPTLLCIDAATGKELWRRSLDAVEAMPAAERDEARTFALETWAWWREQETLWYEALQLWRKREKDFGGWDKPPADIAERWNDIKVAVEAAGCEFKPIKGGAGGVRGPFPVKRRGPAEQRIDRLTELCLMWDTVWRGFGTWVGVAFPSPVSHEGKVWVMTMHNHVSCYTHAGELVWQRRFPRTDWRILTDATKDRVPAKGKWRPGFPGAGGFSTSPLMADGVFLANAGNMLRGLDAATGKPRWELPYAPSIGQSMSVPAIARVDGEAVMIAVGSDAPRDWQRPGDELIRVKDGKAVGFLPGCCAGKGVGDGARVIDGDLVITSVAGDNRQRFLAAYRLAWNGDRSAVTCTEVWRGTKPVGNDFTALVRNPWIDGKAHHQGGVIDLRTGEMVRAPGYQVGQGGYTGHGGFIVGPAFCKWDFYEGAFHFFDRATGTALGTGRLPVHPEDGLPRELQRANEIRGDRWRWLGGGTPFAVGRRLYVRSYDFLWCIGK